MSEAQGTAAAAMKVLVAEDDPALGRVVERCVKKWGYDVTLARDGAEAWEKFEQEQFAIVVTDWEMPEVDGIELVRRIRAEKARRYVYIIMLTGKAEKTQIVAGMESGADDYVPKPVDREELRVRIAAGERIVRLERSLAERNDELTKAHARMKADLEAAAVFQGSLLPNALPETSGVNAAWVFDSCTELAGDALNVFPLDEEHIGAYVLDVSGHGVKAALLSVTLTRLLCPIWSGGSLVTDGAAEGGGGSIVSPAEVIDRINARFLRGGWHEQFFTVVYGVLNVKTREFTYCCAGHPGPVLFSEGSEPTVLESTGWLVGVAEEATFEQEVVALKPGDRLYMFSDGILEMMDDRLEPFDYKHLIETLAGERGKGLEDGLSALVRAAEAWRSAPESQDDRSILALDIGP